jgi:hypothetical protein
VNPSYLTWSQDGVMVQGYQDGEWVNSGLVFPVGFPGTQSVTSTITLASSAAAEGTLETFQNVRLYLAGDPDDIAMIQETWPTYGNAYNPARPELNGGLQISFDGVTYTTFSETVGNQADPSTWILLPSIAMGQGTTDGVLAPYDVAQFYIQFLIPSLADVFQTYNIQLAADVDII